MATTRFVNFASRNMGFRGDRGTWAKITTCPGQPSKLTVCRASQGIISSQYEAELQEFCAAYGIDFRTLRGQKIVEITD